jgi:putative spermidine/putrescine transport system substrate-binding protein
MKKARRLFSVIAVLLAALLVTVNVSSKPAVDVKVAKPVKISILDVAGNLQATKDAIEAFKTAYPGLVSEIEYLKATAPELAPKIEAEQKAGNIQTTLALTGFDGIAAGMDKGLWEKVYPEYKQFFPNLEKNYIPGAKKAFDLFKGYGITVTFCPGGPMFTYNPAKVKKVPKTAQELLDWAKANPGKFLYARPANSGPGRAFLQGLPYILGDKDPKDPKTWTKTWDYLKELDKYIEYYPTGTGGTFKELAEGTRDIIASHLGWDMNQRILATIPANFQAFFLDKTTWVTDSHFMCIPKGLDADRKNVVLALMSFLMEPTQQAITYDNGYFYPGPAIDKVPLSMAPQASQDKVKGAMRAEYDKAMKDLPNTPQLGPAALVEAFDMWDKLVGAKTKK